MTKILFSKNLLLHKNHKNIQKLSYIYKYLGVEKTRYNTKKKPLQLEAAARPLARSPTNKNWSCKNSLTKCIKTKIIKKTNRKIQKHNKINISKYPLNEKEKRPKTGCSFFFLGTKTSRN